IRDDPTGAVPLMWVPVTTTSDTAAADDLSAGASAPWAAAAPASSAQPAAPARRRRAQGEVDRFLLVSCTHPSLCPACVVSAGRRVPLIRAGRRDCAGLSSSQHIV